MAVTATLLKRLKDPQGLRGIFTLVFSGNYATGGASLDFSPKIGYTNRQPGRVEIIGIAGYIYEYDLTNKKVIVRQGAVAGSIVGTFVGTALVGTFAGTAHSHTIFLNDGDEGYSTTATVLAAANKLGASTGGDLTVAGISTTGGSGGILETTDTGTVTVSTPTGTVTAALTGTSAPGGELPASAYPAGVTGDTISAIAIWYL